MALRKFYNQFQTEKDCTEYLRIILENHTTIQCKCGLKKPLWNEKSQLWRCKCTRRITVKSVCFMRDSNIPLLKWFEAIYLFTNTKKPSSDLEFCNKIGIKRYGTVHYLLLKIRKQMSIINQAISFDSSFDLTIKASLTSKVEIALSKSRTRDKIRIALHNHLSNHKFLYSPKYHMKKLLAKTNVKSPTPTENIKVVEHWKNILRINFKKIIKGIHHNTSMFHKQLYLDEYAYKYNNRFEQNRFETFMFNHFSWQNSD